MLISHAHTVMSIPRLIVIPLFLLTISLYLLPRHHFVAFPDPHFPKLRESNVTAASSTFSSGVETFWKSLASSLARAHPQCPPIGVEDGHPSDRYTKFEPLELNKERLERLNLTDQDETSLFRSHHLMRMEAYRLGPQLMFEKGKMGIVTTASPRYMPILLVSLRMLRRTECKLPVEIFLASWDEYDSTICEIILPSMNARCVILSPIYSTVPSATPLQGFQYKIFSILFSTFQHVLFFDTDSFPAFDPTPLFDHAPYTTHGLVTWPDIFANTASSHYYHIASIPEVPVSTRLSTESGQLMLDKEKHRESLLMMVYYNYYGPEYYYPLLCQGSHGAGDKETFITAAMAVSAPFYQVSSPVYMLGHFKDSDFKLVGMAQADPRLDYIYNGPVPNHVHKEGEWHADDTIPPPGFNPDEQEPEPVPQKPRAFFVHQNFHKLDPKRILRDDGPARDVDGQWQRMWGKRDGVRARFGFDVERRLWECVAEEACKDGDEGLCGKMREYYDDIFGLMIENEV